MVALSSPAPRSNMRRYSSNERPQGTTLSSVNMPVACLPAVQFAVFERFGAGEEGLVVGARAAGERELAGVAIDLGKRHAFRGFEVLARAPGQRRLHELGPDRQRRLRAAQADRL